MNEQGPNQIKRLYLHYMTQTTFLSKEEYIYLNPNFIFEVALPNLTELINNYGAGLGGVRILRNKNISQHYQLPLLMRLMKFKLRIIHGGMILIIMQKKEKETKKEKQIMMMIEKKMEKQMNMEEKKRVFVN